MPKDIAEAERDLAEDAKVITLPEALSFMTCAIIWRRC